MPKKHLTKSGRRTGRGLAIVLVLVAAAAGGIYYMSGKPQQQPRGRFNADTGPVPVLAANASYSDVPVYLDAVGTVRALNTVTVRSQVDGKLIAVKFKEGQDVKKGDVLAEIDPATYQAAYDQAVAKKAQDEAQLANAKNDLTRYQQLAATNAINRQQLDTQRALVAQLTAQIQSDQAAIEGAQATLGYTKIVAPIDGRTGLRQVDEGNIIHASDTNGIVVITQIKPIAVLFNLPQQNLDVTNQAFAKGPLPVDVLRADSNTPIDSGRLTVIDNQVDSTTGTVKLKAEFPNDGLRLWPGQFVNVRMLIDTLKHVVTVPTSAVQRGPDGTFVYVVKDDGTAAMHAVNVQKQDESITVLASGVTPPERVVTTGFARLTDGAKVTVGGGAGATPRARPQSGEHPGGADATERRARHESNAGRPNRQQ
ncbi:MAG TPA: efflux RND transporter periplasmic adaptor subunit [Pseudolabrys sp.]|nr:efflux RND transporter periplasmic adaptor subunit [Pseudolabrys sp.]